MPADLPIKGLSTQLIFDNDKQTDRNNAVQASNEEVEHIAYTYINMPRHYFLFMKGDPIVIDNETPKLKMLKLKMRIKTIVI